MSTPAPRASSSRARSVALLAGSLTILIAGCQEPTPTTRIHHHTQSSSHALPLVEGESGAGTRPGAGRGSQPASHRLYQTASVWRVVDGDTVELLFDDGDGEADEDDTFEKLRLRGIDTPEHHASSKLDRDGERSALDRRTIRALGTAATAHAESLLPLGTVVVVEGDDRDRYGRLVAYLTAEDAAGQPFDFGARMIADGYAHAYDGGGRYPHPRMEYYRALQHQAREHRLGLWATDPDATDRLAPDDSP